MLFVCGSSYHKIDAFKSGYQTKLNMILTSSRAVSCNRNIRKNFQKAALSKGLS